MNTWRNPEAHLVDRFHEMVAPIEGLEVRKMFGSPVAFVNGNMVATLIQDTFLVRLSQPQRQERLDSGWSRFEPMPGRPMRADGTQEAGLTRSVGPWRGVIIRTPR